MGKEQYNASQKFSTPCTLNKIIKQDKRIIMTEIKVNIIMVFTHSLQINIFLFV